MGLLDNVLNVFVGDKAKKDLGEIQPLVDLIKSKESEVSTLSLDQLRGKSDEFRAKLKEAQADTKEGEIPPAAHHDAEPEKDVDQEQGQLWPPAVGVVEDGAERVAEPGNIEDIHCRIE